MKNLLLALAVAFGSQALGQEPTLAPVFESAEQAILGLNKATEGLGERVQKLEMPKFHTRTLSDYPGVHNGEKLKQLVASGIGTVIIDEPVQLDVPVVVAPTLELVFTGVGEIVFQGGGKLSIQGPITAPDRLLFRVPLPKEKGQEQLDFFQKDAQPSQCNEHIQEIKAIWFDSTRSDWGEKVNKAIRFGGNNCVIRLSSVFGDWKEGKRHMLRTMIDFDQTRWYAHQTLRGAGHIGSTLCIQPYQPMIGINANNSRELFIDGVRVTEGSGSRRSVCFLGGGTTLRVKNCWFGNAKIGVLVVRGAGLAFDNIQIESCGIAMQIGGTKDPTIPGWPDDNSIRGITVDNLAVYQCHGVGVVVHRNTGYRIIGVRFNNYTANKTVMQPFAIIGDVLVPFMGAYIYECPPAWVKSGARVPWIGSIWVDKDNPNGTTELVATKSLLDR